MHMRSLIHVTWTITLLWSASTAADDGICQNATPNQPIGIDFGPEYIFASYAESLEDFTNLAVLGHEEYKLRVMQLWDEFYVGSNLKSLYSPERPTVFTELKRLLWGPLSALSDRFPIMNHPHVQWVNRAYNNVIARIQHATQQIVSRDNNNNNNNKLTFSNLADTFTDACQEIKQQALADHNTNITFAIMGVPAFFNNTVNDILKESCRKVGIETASQALDRMYASHFLHPAIPRSAHVLELHQGMVHCGIRLSRPAHARRKKEPYLSLHPWGSRILAVRLVDELIKVYPELQLQLSRGADKELLRNAILRARIQLTGRDPAMELIALSAELPYFNSEHTAEEAGDQVDEIPLDLDSWWAYGDNPGVKLTRQQVDAVDDKFVDPLGNSILSYLQAMRQVRTKGEESLQAERVDRVVIVTDWVDGDLLQRAVRIALGDDIRILGGTLPNITMASEGVARIAWQRRQNLLKAQLASGLSLEHNEL